MHKAKLMRVCDVDLHRDGADDAAVMVVWSPRRQVATTLATALITSHVVANVVHAATSSSSCDVDQYFDQLTGECRSCDLLCGGGYGTSGLCAKRCPAGSYA